MDTKGPRSLSEKKKCTFQINDIKTNYAGLKSFICLLISVVFFLKNQLLTIEEALQNKYLLHIKYVALYVWVKLQEL